VGFVTFLRARLLEEHRAAAQRPTSLSRTPGMKERGLRLLEELLHGLGRGGLPDETSLQILLTVYSAHPDFRSEWLPPSLPSLARPT
jgi:hypothetical protein